MTIQEARANSILDTKVNYVRHGGIMTRREFILKVKRDSVPVVEEQVPDDTATRKAEKRIDQIKRLDWVPGNENWPSTKEMRRLQAELKNGYTKAAYRVMWNEDVFTPITKTEYDYWKSLA